MEAVLDASALLAWWLPEQPEGREYARRVAEAGRAGAIHHAPYIFENEIATALLRAMRGRRIDLDTMHVALDASGARAR